MKKVLLLLLLTGCAQTESVRMSGFEYKCQQFGFKSDTIEMAQCKMQMSRNEQANALNSLMLLNTANQTLQAAQPKTQNVKMNCITSQFRGMGNINCY